MAAGNKFDCSVTMHLSLSKLKTKKMHNFVINDIKEDIQIIFHLCSSLLAPSMIYRDRWIIHLTTTCSNMYVHGLKNYLFDKYICPIARYVITPYVEKWGINYVLQITVSGILFTVLTTFFVINSKNEWMIMIKIFY